MRQELLAGTTALKFDFIFLSRIEAQQEPALLTAISGLICGLAGLWSAMVAPAAALLPASGFPTAAPAEYRLQLYHTHTREALDLVFRRGDDYIPAVLDQLNYFLRDHRTGDVTEFDPRLFDLLAELTEVLGRPGGRLEVICGYRTPGTNALLREHSAGVAEQSLHMLGMAIDIRMPGVKTSVLRDTALALQRGGVGYYPGSDFVHVDVGRVRSW